jgi:predicted nucleic acid-binding protein
VTVLVDTPIWSLAYRRGKRVSHDETILNEWSTLVSRQNAVLIGPVRQEILSGFANTARFEILRATLRAFIDLPLTIDDFELAAGFDNLCRRKGIQGSPTDFLICAVSMRYDATIFTTDDDFTRYSTFIGIRLHHRQT